MINNIFEQALNIQEPWLVKSVDFITHTLLEKTNIFIYPIVLIYFILQVHYLKRRYHELHNREN